MTGGVRRENIPVTEPEQLGTSRASVAHAVLAVGMEAMRAKVQEAGYAALANSHTEDERTQRRTETASRRDRAERRWSGE